MYKVAIIGAGSIGALKPNKYDSPEGNSVLTWAHVIKKHDKVELNVIVDKDIDKAEKAAKKWECDYTVNIDPGYDIYIIAAPTETHLDIIKQVVHHNPKLIICEKPFCNSYSEAKEAINILGKIPVLVNYTRRFNLNIRQLKKDLFDNKYGEIYHTVINYDRGFKRDASHAIDLMNYLYGTDGISGFINGSILNNVSGFLPQEICDYSNDDPTYAAYLKYTGCPFVYFCPSDGNKFSVFQIDILTEKGKISLAQHGNIIYTYPIVDEPVYGDYKTLSHDQLKAKYICTQLDRTLLNVVDNAVDFLNGKSKIFCGKNEALEVHRIINYLINGNL